MNRNDNGMKYNYCIEQQKVKCWSHSAKMSNVVCIDDKINVNQLSFNV